MPVHKNLTVLMSEYDKMDVKWYQMFQYEIK